MEKKLICWEKEERNEIKQTDAKCFAFVKTFLILKNHLFWIQTPISSTIASIMLPITVMKSNTFHASLKKFCDHTERNEISITVKDWWFLKRNVVNLLHLKSPNLVLCVHYISLIILTQWPISTGVTIDCYIPMESVIGLNSLQLAFSITIGSFTVVGSMMLLFILEHLTDEIGKSFYMFFYCRLKRCVYSDKMDGIDPFLSLCYVLKLKSSSFFLQFISCFKSLETVLPGLYNAYYIAYKCEVYLPTDHN